MFVFVTNWNELDIKLYSSCMTAHTYLKLIIFSIDLPVFRYLITVTKSLLILVNVLAIKMQLTRPI